MLVKDAVTTISFNRNEMYTIGWILKEKIFEIAKEEQSRNAEEFLNNEYNKNLVKMCSMFLELCGWGEGNAFNVIKEGIEKVISNRKE